MNDSREVKAIKQNVNDLAKLIRGKLTLIANDLKGLLLLSDEEYDRVVNTKATPPLERANDLLQFVITQVERAPTLYQDFYNVLENYLNPQVLLKLLPEPEGCQQQLGLSSLPPAKKPRKDILLQIPEEEPRYDNTTHRNEIFKEYDPIRCTSSDEHQAIKNYAGEVAIVILSCNKNEYYASLELMKAPEITKPDGHQLFERAVRFPNKDNMIIVAGMFAEQKAVIAWTEQGASCVKDIRKLLSWFPSTKALLGVGVAYGMSRDVTKFCDVLVASQVVDYGDRPRFEHGGVYQRGAIVPTKTTLRNIFCKDDTGWEFSCTKTDRKAKVVVGRLASGSFLLDDAGVKNSMEEQFKDVKGGEMEGWILYTHIVEDYPNLEVIIIKGVSDYGDGSKDGRWQLTAAMAAASYTHFQLERCTPFDEDIPASITNSGSMELQSTLREHEDSNATGGKAVLANVPSNQPSFQQLSSTEKEELKAQLKNDEQKMKLLFGSLVTNTRDSVEKRISVGKVAGSILALGAFEPAIGERDRRLLDEHREEIESAKSVSEIFIILSAYWNYLDYDILVYVINHYGTHGDDSDERRLQTYNEALQRFCKCRIFELPLSENGNGAENKKQEKLYIKLNIPEDTLAEQMFPIKRKVAEILQLNPATLQICSVDEGCVQLIFLIPKFVAREIFPLSDEQTSALSKDVSVWRLKCGHYKFESTEGIVTASPELGQENEAQFQTKPIPEKQVQTAKLKKEYQTSEEWREGSWKLTRGRWQVTRMVTKEELGRPVEKVREQMEKLQLHSSHRSEGKVVMLERHLAMPEERVRRLEAEKQARAEQAERSIADLNRRVEEVERRARDAENAATDLIRQTTDANQRMREAEARAQESHHRATQEEQRATQAEQRAAQSDQRATQEEQRATQADQRATQADQRATQADQRATQADQRATQAEERARFLQQQNEEMVVRVRQAEQTAREAQERARMTEQRAQRLQARGHDQFWVVNREEIQLTDQELGRGGWAVVRVAKFRGLKVAAKCLHTLIFSDYNRQLFVREMSIAARVCHPNLVQFIGAMMEGEPIILTELMSTSLRAVLERRPFNPAQITSISLDVARALNYLHLMHPDPIIHRDISSANVLLEPGPSNSWRAKVSDYGSANFLQQLRTAGPGNPTYAAPEADIPSQHSPKMDVYSYGVLLLEMCSQRFPNPEECEALLQRVQQPTMVALIRQCMEQEPTRRPTMSDIIGQLE